MQVSSAFIANVGTAIAQSVMIVFLVVTACFLIIWLAPESTVAAMIQPVVNAVAKLVWAKGFGLGRWAGLLWSSIGAAAGALLATLGDAVSRGLRWSAGWNDWFLQVIAKPLAVSAIAVGTAWEPIRFVSGNSVTMTALLALTVVFFVCLLTRRGMLSFGA